jgi:bacteriocin biosynthesis cyclodehydratase domain-containing protein
LQESIMLRRATDLQLIRATDEEVVLKRGVSELLLRGAGVASLLEALLPLLDGTRSKEQIKETFPGPLRGEVDRLLSDLRRRRMISDLSASSDAGDEAIGDPLQASFYRNFDQTWQGAVTPLRAKQVIIYGVNFISRALVRSLLEMEFGNITLVEDPILSNHLVSHRWVEELDQAAALDGQQRFHFVDHAPSDEALQGAELICATSDFGTADTLFDLNRSALHHAKLFLPVWLSDMVGYLGPLVYPFETACLRCYRLRADSNDTRHALSDAIRAHMTSRPEARPGTGMLPPMAGVLGEAAAMEVVKCLGGFAPNDSVGRSIEINLVSFRSTVRRVLKVPRCPDCSELTRQGAKVLVHGPQIPYRIEEKA